MLVPRTEDGEAPRLDMISSAQVEGLIAFICTAREQINTLQRRVDALEETDRDQRRRRIQARRPR